MDVSNHKNVESTNQYFFPLLPALKGSRSILDIGSGITEPWRSCLEPKTDLYASLDIRQGTPLNPGMDTWFNAPIQPRPTYCLNLLHGTPFADKQWEWGWCCEVLEHMSPEWQQAFVNEVSRICQNIVWTFPTSASERFYDDDGHNEVIIDMSKRHNFNVLSSFSSTGRAIFIWSVKPLYWGTGHVPKYEKN